MARKYNYLSLLNLPDEIRKFGPMQYLWELGGMGEGFLSCLKPLIQKMHSTITKCTMKSHMSSLHYNEIVHSLCQQQK